MRFNILLNYFISYIACTHRKIASRPQVFSPILAFQFAKFLLHSAATSAFHTLHQLTYRDAGRNRHQKVDMICRYMAAQNIYFQLGTGLANQFSQSDCNLPSQHWFPIFGDPDQVILQIVNRMGRFSITHKHHLFVRIERALYHNVRVDYPPPVRRAAHPARSLVENGLPERQGFQPYLQTMK